MLGLVQPPGRVVAGEILFQGRDLLELSTDEMRQIRGRDIAMVFQDPLSSLNPVLRIGHQVEESMRAHDVIAREKVRARSVELLSLVRVPEAASRTRDYHHQFSGGKRQRVMIAMGLSNQPSLLIADEPTTALDVTVQAQILELLRDLNQRTNTAIILITHNLGVVAGLCSRVVVMFAGEIVEEGPVGRIFESPQHPYTWSLLRSLPRIDSDRHERLISIEGLPPDLIALPKGCKFHPRCPFRVERCFTDAPELSSMATGHRAACWVTMRRAYDEMGAGSLRDARPGMASGIHPPGYTPRTDSPLAADALPATAPPGAPSAEVLESSSEVLEPPSGVLEQ